MSALACAHAASRDNLRLMVDKAHLDLTILNTNIAVEKKRLITMKKAAGQAVDDEVVIKPFVRPSTLPPTEPDEDPSNSPIIDLDDRPAGNEK